MRRFIMMISIIPLVLILFCHPVSTNAAGMDPEARGEFSKALEDNLQSSVNYYNKNSFIIKESFDLTGTVMKTIQTDDPDTPENEEVVEEYTSHLAVAYIEYELKRDTFFIFKKTDIYYYDLDKEEFLLASNVFLNDEVKEFFQKYMNDLHKNITPVSLTIFLIMLSTLIFIPVMIMVFHNKGNSSNVNVYPNNRSIRG